MRWLVILLAACGSPAQQPAVSNATTVVADPRCSTNAISELDDRCPSLPPECFIGYDPDQDVDGCPDPPPPQIVFAVGSAEIPDTAANLLDRIAAETTQFAPGVRLEVIGESGPGERAGLDRDRAGAVATTLVARCVLPARLTVLANAPMDTQGSDPPPYRVMIRAAGCK